MKKERLVPKRRFEGFTDEWEKVKVSEIGNDFYGGGTPKTSEESYWKGDIPWIQSSDIDERLFLENLPKNKITYDGIKNSATRLVPENSIAIVTRVGVGKLSLIPYAFTTSQDFFSISKLNVSPAFGVYVLYKILQKEKQIVQGTSIKGITKEDLLQKKLLISNSLNEQQKIGQFFKLLDKMITLEQRKMDKTKALKSAYLAEMFPAEGESVPKRRFAGFVEEWKTSILADIFNVIDGDRGSNYPGESDFNDNGATLFLDTGNVKRSGFDFHIKKYITKEKDDLLRSGKLELNDFVLTSRGTLGNVAHYDKKIKKEHPSVRINSAMLILRPIRGTKIDANFIETVLRGNVIEDFMLNSRVGSAQPHITKRDFSKVSIMKPSTLEEQVKIGEFFKKIDITIRNHQHKLNKLKSTKQAYLHEMFV